MKVREALALLGACALLVAACGGDDDDGSAGGSGVDAAKVLGAKHAASGEPVKVGFVYDGTTDVIDNAGELAAAKAATEYVNDHLGGVAGRPVELDVCSTDQTPAGAADCVSQMAADKVPIVLNGVTGQGPTLFPKLADAGIPAFTPSTGDQKSMFSPGIYLMGNGIVSLVAGPAKIAADADVKRAAIVVIDVPAASGALEEAAPSFYDKVDVEVDIVTIPPDTPDMTPNIAAELSQEPGQIQVIGDPAFCAKALTGIANAGFDGQIVIIPQCIDDALLSSATNLEGAIVTSFTTSDPDSEEFQLYEAVLDTYAGDDLDRGGTAPGGYQAVVGFARAMAGLQGEVTAESVQAALAAMPATPMPLADGITFRCDGKQVAIGPNFCSTDVLRTELDADGRPGPFSVVEGGPLLDIGG
jgi:branched-chain amino acid transport system substrate-binding protein